MTTLVAHPDPAVWVRVPDRYPDARGADPQAWARSVARDYGPPAGAAQEGFRAMMTDLARGEAGRGEGTAWLYLPEDPRGMAKARTLLVPRGSLPAAPGVEGPLAPADDVYVAQHLGPGSRTVAAGRAHPATADLLVTVTYRWDLGDVAVLLLMPTLDPGQAVGMLEELDEFADCLWIDDAAGGGGGQP